MTSVIKGIPVILYEEQKIGVDAFNQPINVYEKKVVSNVLVYPSTPEEIVTSTELSGKKAVYTLAIPKGDANFWEGQRVRFFGEDWKAFGFSIMGIEDNIPLDWNKKVMVERYAG
ncbi:hypothetical protein [Faecalibaculum rodentium]|jgi:hypothetical protein|uniref:hypothetical protein n=1 Tax=Faecalibaculum rodentium TaxID=1702221 RepID=UPI00256F3745|nr:hypothetical protein [Faecalibaculum rodentium]